MNRAPRFRYYAAHSAEDAAAALADDPRAILLAGGTDVVPKLKRRQQTPELVVSLRRAGEMRGIQSNGAMTIGAMTTLRDLAADPRLREYHALFRAVSQIATPLIRNTATLGGNLALDTRCNYYDQSEEWREAIGGCRKAPRWWPENQFLGSSEFRSPEFLGSSEFLPRRDVDSQPLMAAHAPRNSEEPEELRGTCSVQELRGTGPVAEELRRTGRAGGPLCWVAPSSPRCWAVSSSDAAPALIALGARVTLLSQSGERDLPLEDLYRDDGIEPLTKHHGEVLTSIRFPRGWSSTYWKLRRRGSFDFPVLGVGAAIRFAQDGRTVEEARIVLGAVASRPLLLEEAVMLHGRPLTDDLVEDFAERAATHAKPLDNTDFTMTWRKSVARAFLGGVLRELRGDDPASFPLLIREATGGIR
jgi:CO/xanthine dehydrogenase FAD-binding subunit